MESATNDVIYGRCEECHREQQALDPLLHRVFKCNICVHCHSRQKLSRRTKKKKQNHPLNEMEHLMEQEEQLLDAYECVPKSKAKELFLLSESQLKGLPFWNKPNALNEKFAPMKLYLVQHCRKLAYERFGDASGLVAEKRLRLAKKFENALHRTKDVLGKRKATSLSSSSKSNSTRPSGTYVPIQKSDHRHVYVKQTYDEANDCWYKECDCGIKVQFEKIE